MNIEESLSEMKIEDPYKHLLGMDIEDPLQTSALTEYRRSFINISLKWKYIYEIFV